MIDKDPLKFWSNEIYKEELGMRRLQKLTLKIFNIVPHTCEIERLFSLDSLFKRKKDFPFLSLDQSQTALNK